MEGIPVSLIGGPFDGRHIAVPDAREEIEIPLRQKMDGAWITVSHIYRICDWCMGYEWDREAA